jgi:LPXTG-motif cell wall-anchored protein
MWPSFVVLSVLDGLIVHWLPLTGDRQSAASGWVGGLFLGLVGIAAGAPILGFGLRRLRQDMPKVVARDYAGTILVAAVTLMFLVVGLAHHAQVSSDGRALEDAVARAEAYIGDRAPAEFRTNLVSAHTYEIEPGSLYRTCVRNRSGARAFCVVVNRRRPFATSVTFAGSEPNSVLSRGAW